MGASSSKIEEDNALQLCRVRKKFIREALDGRCSLAATHVAYIQSLKIVGTALRKFVEPDAPMESSLYTSTSATPEPRMLTEKSLSQFSFSSPSVSQRMDGTEHFSPSPSPPPSTRYQAHHMKFTGMFSRKVEEKPPVPITGTVTSSVTTQSNIPPSTGRPETPPVEAPRPETPTTPSESETPWDYFGLFHPIDNHFSSQEVRGSNQGLENVDNVRRLREEEGIPDLEDEEEKGSSPGRSESQVSEDEFDEPSADTLVRSFENVNRVPDQDAPSAAPDIPSAESVEPEPEPLNAERSKSPHLSPLRATAPPGVTLSDGVKRSPMKEDGVPRKIAPKNFFASVKEIEHLFIKASESGKEVPRMLEANKFHFRPVLPEKERGSTFLKACFSCGDDPSQFKEEPAQASVKYLTWHRTTSSRSSSSRNPLGANSRDDIEDLTNSLFDSFSMISGGHASTLDRLYAWERKLYDEVKASKLVRKKYDLECRFLRQIESKGESSSKIDKTRAVVKDLHSRIRVAVHRIDTISKKVEELRDQELQPQLEELIEGLRRMWDVMFECHKLQFQTISDAYDNGHFKISLKSEARRHIAIHLEHVLTSLSSSFTKWIGAQEFYIKAINDWLMKCVSLPQQSSKRKRRMPAPSIRNFGPPPIYVTCSLWLEMLSTLPTKNVAESIKGLTLEVSHFLPRQEKNQGKGKMNHPNSTSYGEMNMNLLRDETLEDDFVMGFDRFKTSLVGFLGQLNNFAESSLKMFTDLENAIEKSKNSYYHFRPRT